VIEFLTPVTVIWKVSSVLIWDFPFLSEIMICMAFVWLVYWLHEIASKMDKSVEKQ
jgi:uncharacterized membrane protein